MSIAGSSRDSLGPELMDQEDQVRGHERRSLGVDEDDLVGTWRAQR